MLYNVLVLFLNTYINHILIIEIKYCKKKLHQCVISHLLDIEQVGAPEVFIPK
jgi:hypothetical protein